jgi:hypothetical protein
MMNSFTEHILAKQKQKDMLAQAEHERLVTQIIRWIKQDAKDERETSTEMQLPEISIYDN